MSESFIKTYSLTMVGEVVAQGRPRYTNAPFPHAYDPKKSRDFKAMLAYCAQQEVLKQGGEVLDGAISMTIHVEIAPPKSWSKSKRQRAIEGFIKPTVKPDVDNICKSIMDALTGVWYADDKQIFSIMILKEYAERSCYHVNCMEVLAEK